MPYGAAAWRLSACFIRYWLSKREPEPLRCRGREVLEFPRAKSAQPPAANTSGLTVEAAGREARLRCAFQRLDARATAAGLWVTSTVSGAKGEPFRVIARALGRDQGAPLPTSGTVGTDGELARFSRQGLIEEYSVSVDGVQQDFVLEHRPPAKGG